jgi:biotin operon repressor
MENPILMSMNKLAPILGISRAELAELVVDGLLQPGYEFKNSNRKLYTIEGAKEAARKAVARKKVSESPKQDKTKNERNGNPKTTKWGKELLASMDNNLSDSVVTASRKIKLN